MWRQFICSQNLSRRMCGLCNHIATVLLNGLRNYGEQTKTIWGGDNDCQHEWEQNIQPKRKGSTDADNSYQRPSRIESQKMRNIKSDFCIKCNAWNGQLGLEPSPELFIQHILQITAELKRVLKKSGSFYLNIGDSYGGSGGAGGDYNKGGIKEGHPKYKQGGKTTSKCLLGIPWRIAIAMTDTQGWILRNSIIWQKPNHMPCSVKDRLANSYEFVFFFVKSKRYYYDLDSIREPIKDISIARYGRNYGSPNNKYNDQDQSVIGGARIDLRPAEFKDQMEYRKALWGNRGLDISCQFNKEKRQKMLSEIEGSNTGFNNKEPYKENNPHRDRLTKTPEEQAERYHRDKTNDEDYKAGGMRNAPEPGEENAFHPLGKNPGDVITTDKGIPPGQDADQFRRKGHSGYYDKDGNLLVNPNGKNPGDVISSKYLDCTDGHSNRQGLNRPLDTITIKAYAEYQKPIAEYLKMNIKPEHKSVLDNTFGEHKWKHWIRTDYSGAALPGVEDWKLLKQIIGFDDTFDDKIYETQKLNIPIFQLGNQVNDIWKITTRGFKGAHFAVYPESLCEKPIKSSCPAYICNKCGKARERIYKLGKLVSSGPNNMAIKPRGFAQNDMIIQDLPKDPYGDMPRREKQEVGLSDCKCNAGFSAGIVLDPFAGAGTTLVVAKKLHRNYLGIEINPDYVKIAEKRLANTAVNKELF